MSLQSTSSVQSSLYQRFQQEIADVQKSCDKALADKKDKIPASSGLLLWRPDAQGNPELLLGRIHKEPSNDPEKVNGAFVNFSGKVEFKDCENPEIPNIIATAAREVDEETNGLIESSEVLVQIAAKTTQCVKNATWGKGYCAATFTVCMDVSDEKLEAFKAKPSKEITEMKWIPLKEILVAQSDKDALYQETLQKIQASAGRDLSTEEKSKNPELVAAYKAHLRLPSGDEVASYVARTVVLAQQYLVK